MRCASSPGGAAVWGHGGNAQGEGETDPFVPTCTWWQVLPTSKLVDGSQDLQCGLLPLAQCVVRRQIRVGSGNPEGPERTLGIHPGLAEWQKMCFLGTFKVSWLAFRRGKENDMNLLGRKGKLCK